MKEFTKKLKKRKEKEAEYIKKIKEKEIKELKEIEKHRQEEDYIDNLVKNVLDAAQKILVLIIF
jgi:hypothetical protein